MINKSDTHMGISYFERIVDSDIEDTIEEFKSEGLNFEVHKLVPEPYASGEWLMPTAVAVYIAKSYFDGFLNEMGKEHYFVVKERVKKLAAKCKNIGLKTYTAAGSTEKAPKAYNQSLDFSILIKTKEDRTIKLLFDNDLTKEEWDQAIDTLFDYIDENYEKYPNDKLTDATKELYKNPRFYLYALIDKDNKRLVFYDDFGLMRMVSTAKPEIKPEI